MNLGLYLASTFGTALVAALFHAIGSRKASAPAAPATPAPTQPAAPAAPAAPADPFAGVPGLPGHPAMNAINFALHSASFQQTLAAGLGQVAQVIAPYLATAAAVPTAPPAAK